MLTASADFLAAIRAPHILAVEAIAYPPGGQPVALPIEDGAVTIDRTAEHRRHLDLTVAPKFPSDHPLAGLDVYPNETTDPVNVYGTEIVVKRGVRFASNAVEMPQLGIFRIEDASRDTPGGGVTITGWDRSRQVLDARFLKPRKFASQLAVTLIQLLITEVFPTATFEVLTSDATTIPKHVVDRDRWAEVLRVAQVIGCEVFATEQGTWRIQDVPNPATATPVWTVDAGVEGVLVSVGDTVTREGAPNIVVAIGESVSGNTAPVVSASPHGYDTNPLSPTYYLGGYGQVPRFYSSPHIRTQAQADKVADSQLADHLGVSRTINFNAVPNPALDAGDAINITRPGETAELHLIDALTIPLSPGGVMSGESRALDWTAE